MASLAAVAAFLLALCASWGLFPTPPPGLLAVVGVLAVSGLGWVPYGCLGLPGEWADVTGGMGP